MHIVYLHQYFCPPEGQGNNRSYEFAREWAKNHTVTVITTKAYFPKKYFDNHTFKHKICELNIDNIQVKVLDIEYSHNMRYTQRIMAFIRYMFYALKYIKKIKDIDWIYASSTPLSVGWIAYQCKKRGIPYFFEVVDLWPDVPIAMGIIRNSVIKKWLYAWEKKIYEKASFIITLSQGMTDKIIQKNIPENKIYTIPNGTNTTFFKPCDSNEKKKYKIALGFRKEDILALYSGTVGRANGVHHLIEIARIAQNEGLYQLKFVILGTGNRIDKVQKLAQKYELNNVFFYPPVPKSEILPYFYASDIGIITFENYPILNTNSANKFFDYLSVGLPICANYQGWQADIGHEKIGLFAPCNEIEVFYQNLKKMVINTDIRSRFANHSIELAQKYNRTVLAHQVLSLMEKGYAKR